MLALYIWPLFIAVTIHKDTTDMSFTKIDKQNLVYKHVRLN